MNKKSFDELLASVKEAGAIKRGTRRASRRFVSKPMDIRCIRAKMDVSQGDFAELIGVSVDTVQNWEQGRRTPTGPARVLLTVAERAPEYLIETLHRA